MLQFRFVLALTFVNLYLIMAATVTNTVQRRASRRVSLQLNTESMQSRSSRLQRPATPFRPPPTPPLTPKGEEDEESSPWASMTEMVEALDQTQDHGDSKEEKRPNRFETEMEKVLKIIKAASNAEPKHSPIQSATEMTAPVLGFVVENKSTKSPVIEAPILNENGRVPNVRRRSSASTSTNSSLSQADRLQRLIKKSLIALYGMTKTANIYTKWVDQLWAISEINECSQKTQSIRLVKLDPELNKLLRSILGIYPTQTISCKVFHLLMEGIVLRSVRMWWKRFEGCFKRTELKHGERTVRISEIIRILNAAIRMADEGARHLLPFRKREGSKDAQLWAALSGRAMWVSPMVASLSLAEVGLLLTVHDDGRSDYSAAACVQQFEDLCKN